MTVQKTWLKKQKLINESVGDFNIYHYVLNEYHWTPKQWAEMSRREQALVVASIEVRQNTKKKKREKQKERLGLSIFKA